MHLHIDPGDIGAPPGSPRWAIAVRSEACVSKREGQSAVSNLQAWLRMLRRDDNFRNLVDVNDTPFMTWEDFVQYREPFGLGMRVEVANAVLAEKDQTRLLSDVVADVPVLAKNGTNQHSDTQRGVDVIRPSSRGGTSATYLAARLKRDAPEIAARIDDYPSMHAAALAAGIIKPVSSLDKMRRAWRHATPEERATFMAEVTA